MIYGSGISDVISWYRSHRYPSTENVQLKNGKYEYESNQGTTGSSE